MASGAGWNVRGVDPEVREIARGLAYRSGLTLGEWLSRVIAQGVAAGELTAQGESPPDLAEELGAIAEALENPIPGEASAPAGKTPIGALDPTIVSILARIDASERTAVGVGRQLERLLEEFRESQEQVNARLRWMEDEIARLLEPVREKEATRQREAQKKLTEKLDVDAPAAGGAAGASKPFGRGRLTMKHFVDPETAPWAPAPAPASASAEPEVMFTFVAGSGRRWVAEPASNAASDEDGEAPAEGSDPEGLLFLDERVEEPQELRPSATRNMIEQARAAAQAAAAAEAEAALQKRSQSRSEMLFAGFASRGGKEGARRARLTLTSALFMSAAGATLGVGFAGYEMAFGKPQGALPIRVAEALEQPTMGREQAAGEGRSFAGLAFSAKLAAQSATQAVLTRVSNPQSASVAQTAKSLYAEAVSRIDARDFGGVEQLRKSAVLGDADAQFYLSRLYESGQAGLKKDPAKARHWTEKAALGGDPKAMHNLGLYYFDGELGAKDPGQAAQWFRRAADLGVVDSQYNMGRLYEDGVGVGRNLAEAYKWYLIAAKAGDGQSGLSAQRVKGHLSRAAQATAEHLAQAYAPLGPRAAAAQPTLASMTTTSDANLVTAQRALSRLGYYQGPADGVASPALSMAIAAYQRDQKLPVTGALDPRMNQGLDLIAQ